MQCINHIDSFTSIDRKPITQERKTVAVDYNLFRCKFGFGVTALVTDSERWILRNCRYVNAVLPAFACDSIKMPLLYILRHSTTQYILPSPHALREWNAEIKTLCFNWCPTNRWPDQDISSHCCNINWSTKMMKNKIYSWIIDELIRKYLL